MRRITRFAGALAGALACTSAATIGQTTPDAPEAALKRTLVQAVRTTRDADAATRSALAEADRQFAATDVLATEIPPDAAPVRGRPVRAEAERLRERASAFRAAAAQATETATTAALLARHTTDSAGRRRWHLSAARAARSARLLFAGAERLAARAESLVTTRVAAAVHAADVTNAARHLPSLE